MIAPLKNARTQTLVPAWHADFEAMLPAIVTHARIAFGHLAPRHRGSHSRDGLQCVPGQRWLVELGKTDVAFPTALAKFGVRQTREGRKVGGKLNCRDVSSNYCQQKKDLLVERLDRYDSEEQAWEEVLIEDKRSGPAATAAIRIDFRAWLQLLPAPPAEGRDLPGQWRDHDCSRGQTVPRLARPESRNSAGSCSWLGTVFRVTNSPWPRLIGEEAIAHFHALWSRRTILARFTFPITCRSISIIGSPKEAQRGQHHRRPRNRAASSALTGSWLVFVVTAGALIGARSVCRRHPSYRRRPLTAPPCEAAIRPIRCPPASCPQGGCWRADSGAQARLVFGGYRSFSSAVPLARPSISLDFGLRRGVRSLQEAGTEALRRLLARDFPGETSWATRQKPKKPT